MPRPRVFLEGAHADGAAPRGRPAAAAASRLRGSAPRLTAFASATTTSWKVRIAAAGFAALYMIMSAPASTAATAACGTSKPASEMAPALNESVTTRPSKCRVRTSSLWMATTDRLAGRRVRPGTTAFDIITAGVLARMPARNGGSPTLRSLDHGNVYAVHSRCSCSRRPDPEVLQHGQDPTSQQPLQVGDAVGQHQGRPAAERAPPVRVVGAGRHASVDVDHRSEVGVHAERGHSVRDRGDVSSDLALRPVPTHIACPRQLADQISHPLNAAALFVGHHEQAQPVGHGPAQGLQPGTQIRRRRGTEEDDPTGSSADDRLDRGHVGLLGRHDDSLGGEPAEVPPPDAHALRRRRSRGRAAHGRADQDQRGQRSRRNAPRRVVVTDTTEARSSAHIRSSPGILSRPAGCRGHRAEGRRRETAMKLGHRGSTGYCPHRAEGRRQEDRDDPIGSG